MKIDLKKTKIKRNFPKIVEGGDGWFFNGEVKLNVKTNIVIAVNLIK